MKTHLIRVLLFFAIAIISVQETNAQRVIGDHLSITFNRGRNDCWFAQNPAHDWTFYINGQARHRTGLGGPFQLTIEIPLRNHEFGTSISLSAEIWETKCSNGKPQYVGRQNFGRINIPAKKPALQNLWKGVYELSVSRSNRKLRINSHSGHRLSTHSQQFTRIIFEPTDIRGTFYLRVNGLNQYLSAAGNEIGMSAHLHPNNAKFEVERRADGSYLLKQGGRYLYEEEGSGRIKRGYSGRSSNAHFVLREVPRVVRFLATGDPQLENGDMAHDDDQFQRPRAVLDKFATFSYNQSNPLNSSTRRGVIISGDLTQNTRRDEFDKYKKLTGSYAPYVFEGLGNHDMVNEKYCWLVRAGVCPEIIENYITRNRSQRFANRQGIHYSWNWDDVHFVQLNLYPGNADGPTSAASNLSPKKSLDFLIQDLAKQVGNSGRPVVLIHHYGFDNTSITSGRTAGAEYGWTVSETKAYWNAIASYNVVGIITGHLHGYDNPTYEDWWKTNAFNRPAGARSRPDGKTQIPAFIAGGATYGGYYVDFTIEGNELSAIRYKAQVNGDGEVTGFREVGQYANSFANGVVTR